LRRHSLAYLHTLLRFLESAVPRSKLKFEM
jgi:hypothetical protein